jgi:glycosyltransferase involved in cell wall biosynthesis
MTFTGPRYRKYLESFVTSFMAKLTVCLLTYNSERLLEECIEPLIRVADEMVVVDSGSSDNTLKILLEHGIQAVHRAYTTHSDQMNYAISLAHNDWVLCMDSDEILDQATIDEVLRLKDRLKDETRAYRISRYWYALGQPVRALYPVSSPDFPVRLFHRGRARFNGAPVDDKVFGFGETEVIPGRVKHDTFFSLHEVFAKLNTYTSRLCQDKPIKSSLPRALFNPFFALIKWYVVKGGWKDGRVGVVLAAYAFLYTFLKYLKAWYYGTPPRVEKAR